MPLTVIFQVTMAIPPAEGQQEGNVLDQIINCSSHHILWPMPKHLLMGMRRALACAVLLILSSDGETAVCSPSREIDR
jgi:hypothetical protein